MKMLRIIIFLCAIGNLIAQELVVPDSITNATEFKGIRLLDYVMYLQDTTKSLTIDEVLLAESEGAFKQLPDEFRYSGGSVYWLKVRLRSLLEVPHEFMINFYGWNKRVTLFEHSNLHAIGVTGGMVNVQEKTYINDFVYSFLPISLSNELKEYYVKVELSESNSSFVPVMNLYNASPIRKNWNKLRTQAVFFLAVFTTSIFYNLFLFLMTRQSVNLYYMLYGLFFGGFIISIPFFPNIFSSFHATMVALVSLNLSTFFFSHFSREFLRLKEDFQIGNLILKWLGWLALIFTLPFVYQTVLVVELYPARWQDPALFLTFLLSATTLIISIFLVRKGSTPARYFLAANSIWIIIMFLVGPIYMLGVRGVGSFYEIRYTTLLMAGIGGISQILLFGLLTGHRVLKLQKDRSLAIQEKLETQQNINLQLEQKVSERTSQLEHRNKENELLLGEIHHRVKNNLQVISSLLKLQSRQLNDGKAKSAVLEGRDRVKAMALIHQRLYQQDRFSTIEMHDYIQNLVENLAQSYGYGESDFDLELEIPKLHLDVDSTIPIGLIINELVSNCFKHAFTMHGDNRLTIQLHETGDELNLLVTDNGPGINITEDKNHSFGLDLIHALAEELDGSVTYEDGQGTKVWIGLKDYKIVEKV